VTGKFAADKTLGNHQPVTGRIYSVGYEGLNVDGLVDRLVSARVTLLVDVRLNPISRKPGFSKKTLSSKLEAAGIEYRHEAALGNPPENRDSFRRGNGDEGRRKMRKMLLNSSNQALMTLVDDARSRWVAVMCFERGPQQCHRQVITDMAREVDTTIDVCQIL
jgi:uncharacterized protein (DUF488 family)